MTIADVSRTGAPASSGSSLLVVEDLVVDYEPLDGAPVRAVDGVGFELAAGEFVGLVGESGSGKSTLGFAITRLQRPPARTVSGRILFQGSDIREVSQPDLRRQRQGGFAMVLQSGMNALNPVRTVRDHFRDVFRAHGHVPRRAWDERTAELVDMVQLGTDVLGRYPGELSGGMRQRVSIALALALEPRLLVFDEPTTALDVLVQRSIMETIARLQREQDFTALLISHDLGVVLEATRRVMVMHEGRIVEDAPSSQILHAPRDEYTRMLLSHYADPRAERVELPGFPARETRTRTDAAARPDGVVTRRPDGASARPDGAPLVVDGVSKTYPARRRRDEPVHAVRDVSFELAPGAALALVGQSGSGKSTIGAMIAGITAPTTGSVRFGDRDVGALRGAARRQLHRDIQVVFQDPYAALNPVTSVGYAIARPVANHAGLRGEALQARVAELLETVGLSPADSFAGKLPHELSGGQRQRVVIARALATNPKVLIADEPVSMLDVTLRAGILALLDDLRRERGVALLYITHDLLSARLVTDDVLVLHDGAVVERGPTAEVLRHPTDEYTVRLLDAIPNPGGRREAE